MNRCTEGARASPSRLHEQTREARKTTRRVGFASPWTSGGYARPSGGIPACPRQGDILPPVLPWEVGPLIRLFASDLDGTLFNALHQTDRAILSQLRRVLDAGRHVALATGRAVRLASSLGFGDLPLETVSANGALVCDARGELLRFSRLDPEVLGLLLSAFPTVCFSCIAADGTYVRGTRESHAAGLRPSPGPLGWLVAQRMRRQRPAPDMRFDQTDRDVLARPICKVNFRVSDEALRRELLGFVDDHAGSIVNASFDGDLFELTDASVNKGEAVAWLARHLGIDEEEVAVYGDGGNDLAMLERFSHAYAPRGASAAARRAAGSVIGSCALHAVPRHMLATTRREER